MSVEMYYNRGQEYPYDGGEKAKARKPADWAVKAARGVLSNLSDRRGIKQELEQVDDDVREELIDTIAEIIRHAAIQK